MIISQYFNKKKVLNRLVLKRDGSSNSKFRYLAPNMPKLHRVPQANYGTGLRLKGAERAAILPKKEDAFFEQQMSKKTVPLINKELVLPNKTALLPLKTKSFDNIKIETPNEIAQRSGLAAYNNFGARRYITAHQNLIEHAILGIKRESAIKGPSYIKEQSEELFVIKTAGALLTDKGNDTANKSDVFIASVVSGSPIENRNRVLHADYRRRLANFFMSQTDDKEVYDYIMAYKKNIKPTEIESWGFVVLELPLVSNTRKELKENNISLEPATYTHKISVNPTANGKLDSIIETSTLTLGTDCKRSHNDTLLYHTSHDQPLKIKKYHDVDLDTQSTVFSREYKGFPRYVNGVIVDYASEKSKSLTGYEFIDGKTKEIIALIVRFTNMKEKSPQHTLIIEQLNAFNDSIQSIDSSLSLDEVRQSYNSFAIYHNLDAVKYQIRHNEVYQNVHSQSMHETPLAKEIANRNSQNSEVVSDRETAYELVTGYFSGKEEFKKLEPFFKLFMPIIDKGKPCTPELYPLWHDFKQVIKVILNL